MAADPATQFNRPGLSYSYTPVKTELNPPIQLPGTGELWAQAGKNAMAGAAQVFDTLMKSPLNPQVKKQMELGVKTAQQGIDTIDWARSQPSGAGHWITGIDANGHAYLIPVATGGPNVQALVGQEDIDKGNKPKGGRVNDPTESSTKSKTAPPAPGTSPTLPGGPPPGTFMNPASNSFEPLQQPSSVTSSTSPSPAAKPPDSNVPPTNPADLNRQPGTQITPATTNMFAATNSAQAPSPTDFQAPNQAQTDVAVRESLSRNRFASSEQGIPADYQPPAPQSQDQTPLSKQLMSQWQNQNAHPVAPAIEAKKWAQNNFDTRVQDATYMPHGGPLNQPAYAFHMKGGGTNLVPLSQMVQNGFAPNVAGNNTSMTLSAADEVRQQGDQQMRPTGAVGGQAPALQQGQGTQPAAQMQPTGNVGQPQPPPAAPEMRDIYGNPISAYTSIPSKGGPSATQLTADTESAGTKATALPISQEEQNRITEELNKRPQSEKDKLSEDPNTGDPEVGRWGGRTYYEDKSGNAPGRYYTTLPGQTSTWTQQRFYFGTDGYHEYPLKDSVIRKNMENEFSGAGGIPGKVFTREEIANMPTDVVKDWLMRAKWYHNTGGDPTGPTQQRLDAQAETSKSLQRLIDMAQEVKESGIDPKTFNIASSGQSEEAARRDALLPPRGQEAHTPGEIWNLAQAGFHGAMAGSAGTRNPLADAMAAEVKHLSETMVQTPGLQYTTRGEGKKAEIPIGGGVAGFYGNVNIPLGGDPSNLKEINRLFQGGDIDETLGGLKGLKSRIDRAYHDTSETAILDGFRVGQNHLNNQTALANKKPLADPDNKFRDADGNLFNPYAPPKPISKNGATLPYTYRDPTEPSFVRATRPTAQPTPLTVIRNDAEMEEFKKNHPGEHFKAPDGRGGYIEYH